MDGEMRLTCQGFSILHLARIFPYFVPLADKPPVAQSRHKRTKLSELIGRLYTLLLVPALED